MKEATVKKDMINVEFNTKLPFDFIPSKEEVFDPTIFHPNVPLTKGEEIAVRAMAAMLSNPQIVIRADNETMVQISRSAIYMADVMMKSFNERSK